MAARAVEIVGSLAPEYCAETGQSDAFTLCRNPEVSTRQCVNSLNHSRRKYIRNSGLLIVGPLNQHPGPLLNSSGDCKLEAEKSGKISILHSHATGSLIIYLCVVLTCIPEKSEEYLYLSIWHSDHLFMCCINLYS